MKKLLILSLTSTFLLGACGFNNDTNNTQDSNKNIKKSNKTILTPFQKKMDLLTKN